MIEFVCLSFSGPCNWKAAKVKKHDFYPHTSLLKRNQVQMKMKTFQQTQLAIKERKPPSQCGTPVSKKKPIADKIMTAFIFMGLTNNIHIKIVQNCPTCYHCIFHTK